VQSKGIQVIVLLIEELVLKVDVCCGKSHNNNTIVIAIETTNFLLFWLRRRSYDAELGRLSRFSRLGSGNVPSSAS